MKKNSIFLKLIIILFVLSGTIFAQITQQWVQTYNGPGNGEDYINSMAIDASGNVYVTGSSDGTAWGEQYRDYATIKYNSSGVQQWIQRYDGTGNNTDKAYSIAVDGNGNVYVTGSSRSSSANGTEDYATIKYNSSGVQQWVQRYNGTGNSMDIATKLAVDGSGNVYVTGRSVGTTALDFATIKYNTNGVQQWVQRYNGSGNDTVAAFSLALDGSANVYVVGCGYSGSDFDNYITVKYNTNGVQQWAQIYNGPGNDRDQSYAIAVDVNGNAYVTGYSRTGQNETTEDITTVKYNSSGVQQWVGRYNGPSPGREWGYAIAVSGSGNVYVTGWSPGNGTGNDYATIKYNSAGTQQWVQRYNGTGGDNDQPVSLALDNSENVYITGSSRSGNTEGTEDIATIKYNSGGVQQWILRYNGPGNSSDGGSSVAVDDLGNVYIAGVHRTGPVAGTEDFYTAKYSQQIGIQIISTEIPNSFSLSQNYPNPFNPNTVISFQLPKFNYVSLRVFDALGREVAALVNEQLKPGTYQVDWDASNYSSGMYFYKLAAGDYVETKKMILTK